MFTPKNDRKLWVPGSEHDPFLGARAKRSAPCDIVMPQEKNGFLKSLRLKNHRWRHGMVITNMIKRGTEPAWTSNKHQHSGHDTAVAKKSSWCWRISRFVARLGKIKACPWRGSTYSGQPQKETLRKHTKTRYSGGPKPQVGCSWFMILYKPMNKKKDNCRYISPTNANVEWKLWKSRHLFWTSTSRKSEELEKSTHPELLCAEPVISCGFSRNSSEENCLKTGLHTPNSG